LKTINMSLRENLGYAGDTDSDANLELRDLSNVVFQIMKSLAADTTYFHQKNDWKVIVSLINCYCISYHVDPELQAYDFTQPDSWWEQNLSMFDIQEKSDWRVFLSFMYEGNLATAVQVRDSARAGYCLLKVWKELENNITVRPFGRNYGMDYLDISAAAQNKKEEQQWM